LVRPKDILRRDKMEDDRRRVRQMQRERTRLDDKLRVEQFTRDCAANKIQKFFRAYLLYIQYKKKHADVKIHKK